MSHIALARKWRPRTFSQLVGQNHVRQALIHSLNEQRLHHAYIFTGTRGVGKTSIARLFAKALNCEEGISAEPCLQCDACLAIEQGHFLDLIEIDAASKTGVDEMRQMLDNTQYLPTNGRFKIYLIDEVHMLSQSSFNALLKTLEEPPAHVKFFLATTDPQKIPITVLSRCLQFGLRAISEEAIAAQLIYILNEESIPFERSAIDIISHAAQGSLRDGLSLLDQALAIGNQKITLETTQSMLGYTHQDYALRLLQALAENNAKSMLTLAAEIGQEGGYYSYVTEKMLQYLHQLIVYQQVGHDVVAQPNSDELVALAGHWSGEALQLFYQILLHGQEDLSLAPMPAIGFDVMLVRLLQFEPAPKQVKPDEFTRANTAPRPVSQGQQHPNRENNATTNAESKEKSTPSVNEFQSPLQTITTGDLSELKVKGALEFAIPDKKILSSQILQNDSDKKRLGNPEQADDLIEWASIVAKLDITGMAKTAVVNTSLKSIDDSKVNLVAHGGYLSLFIPSVRERISDALTTYFKRPMKLHIEEASEVGGTPAKVYAAKQEDEKKKAIDAIDSDPVVQQIKENFSANVFENSITLRTDEL